MTVLVIGFIAAVRPQIAATWHSAPFDQQGTQGRDRAAEIRQLGRNPMEMGTAIARSAKKFAPNERGTVLLVMERPD